MDEASIRKLRVVDLKAALKTLGLDTKGKKQVLVDRLIEHYAADNADSLDKTDKVDNENVDEPFEEITPEEVEQAKNEVPEVAKVEILKQDVLKEPISQASNELDKSEDIPEVAKVELCEKRVDEIEKNDTEKTETEDSKPNEPAAQIEKQATNEEPSDQKTTDEIPEESSSKSETIDKEEIPIKDHDDDKNPHSQDTEPVQLTDETADQPSTTERRTSEAELIEKIDMSIDEPILIEKPSEAEVETLASPYAAPSPAGSDDLQVIKTTKDDAVELVTTTKPTDPIDLETPAEVIDLEEAEKPVELDDSPVASPEPQQPMSPLLNEKVDEGIEILPEDKNEKEVEEIKVAKVKLPEIIHDPERRKIDEDLKSGKITKAKAKKLKSKLAKRDKKRRDALAFTNSLKADTYTKRKRKGMANIEVDYVVESMDLDETLFNAEADSMYPADDIERSKSHFDRVMKIFESGVKISDGFTNEDLNAAVKAARKVAEKTNAEFKKPKADEKDEDDDDEKQLSRRKMKQLHRPSVSQLKSWASKPDVVEMHDVTSSDPRLLVHLKGYRNTVPIPRHWCLKRKYLTSKRGFEKPPFELPDFIKKTGITEMREALQEKEDIRNRAAKQRQKMRPKLGKINIDYEKLHDAFFRYQTKPKIGNEFKNFEIEIIFI